MNALAKIDNAALCSIELEQEILGSVIISNIAATVLEREVFASDFSEPLHSQISEAICRVHCEHGSVSPSLIIAAMGGDASVTVGDGTTLGQYIARLAAAACVPGAVKAYAKQLREFANRRNGPAGAWQIMKFYTDKLTINAGDTVVFKINSAEINNVLLLGAGAQFGGCDRSLPV